MVLRLKRGGPGVLIRRQGYSGYSGSGNGEVLMLVVYVDDGKVLISVMALVRVECEEKKKVKEEERKENS